MHTRHNAGFTLMEALVGIAIAGLVLSMLGATFHFSIEEWRREQQRDNGGVRAAVRLLTAQLASYDPVAQSGDDARFLGLQGTSSQLIFPTFLSLRSWHNGAPVLVRYVFNDGEKGILQYSETSLDSLVAADVRTFRMNASDIAFSEVDIPATMFTFAYERSKNRGRSTVWDRAPELPEAIICRYRAPGDTVWQETALYPGAFDFPGRDRGTRQ